MRRRDLRAFGAILLLATSLSLGLGCSSSADREAGAASWHLEEIGRFGSLEEEGSALSQVAGLTLTDSTVLILESNPPRVAVFDYEGQWLRDFGRSGDGPGELRAPLEIGISEGNIWVGDLNGMRLEVFAPDGTPLASHRWNIPQDSLGDLAVPTALLSDGSVLATPRGVISPNVRSRPHYRTTPDGEVLDLLYRQEVAERDMFVAQLPGNRFTVGLHPIRESAVVDILPNGEGLVVVEQSQATQPSRDSFRVKIIAPDDIELREFSVPYTPVSADGWLDRFIERMEEEIHRSGPVDREQIAAIRESLSPRSYYPPVSGVVAGSDGTIWVRREEFILADSVRWQVFDANGRELGAITASTDFGLLRSSLEEVWAVHPGDLDVPFVVRMRVRPPN